MASDDMEASEVMKAANMSMKEYEKCADELYSKTIYQ